MCNMYFFFFLFFLSKSNCSLMVVPVLISSVSFVSFFLISFCHLFLNVSVKYPHGFGGTGPSALIERQRELHVTMYFEAIFYLLCIPKLYQCYSC